MSHAESSRGRAHTALLLVGAAYLAGVWLEGVGSTIPAALLPRTPLYFLQIAALFPHAAVNVIDYRAEVWLCQERRWQEIDTRPYFRIDPDDKENRFQRVMHFFRDNRPTMHALDDYLLTRHAEGGHADGVLDGAKLGGIRVLSLRLPLPSPEAPLEREHREPLTSYPKDVRKNFYYTTKSRRAERCGYVDPPHPAKGEDVGPVPSNLPPATRDAGSAPLPEEAE
jgi:hypothetical protein